MQDGGPSGREVSPGDTCPRVMKTQFRSCYEDGVEGKEGARWVGRRIAQEYSSF